MGPTAVGKSKVAVEVAGILDGEIISADSAQVYQGLDIGTAKLKPEEMYAANGKFIPHHLVNILPPDADFSVADFQREARQKIVEINARGKIPLLVGGSGLYVQAVVDPYYFPPLKKDRVLREKLWEEAKTRGNEYLYARLKVRDPLTARKVHPNDLKRIIRALEVSLLTQKPLSYFQANKQEAPAYRLAFVGLTLKRENLYARIEARVEKMLTAGLVQEVKGLIAQGYSPNLNALQNLGYKQIIGYLQGKYDFLETVRILKRDTRHFAKRQLTWFRRDPRIFWFQGENYPNFLELAQEIAAYASRTISLYRE